MVSHFMMCISIFLPTTSPYQGNPVSVSPTPAESNPDGLGTRTPDSFPSPLETTKKPLLKEYQVTIGFVVLFVLAIWGYEQLGNREVEVGAGTLRYRGVSKDTATKVAAVVNEQKLFGGKPWWGELRYQDRRYEFRYSVIPGAEHDDLSLPC